MSARFSDYVCHIAEFSPPWSPNAFNSLGTLYHIKKFISYNKVPKCQMSYMAVIDSDIEPRSYKQAMQDLQWRVVMAIEIRHSNSVVLGQFKISLQENTLLIVNESLKSRGQLMVPLNVIKLV